MSAVPATPAPSSISVGPETGADHGTPVTETAMTVLDLAPLSHIRGHLPPGVVGGGASLSYLSGSGFRC